MQLIDPVTNIPGVGPSYAKKLEKLNILTVRDLLYHIPSRYLDFRNVTTLNRVQPDESYTVAGTVDAIETTYTRNGKKLTTAIISDEFGHLQLIWFNQTFITKVIGVGDYVSAAGKISWWDKQKAIIAPLWKKFDEQSNALISGDILAMYPETQGVTSNWFRNIIANTWEVFKEDVTKEWLSRNTPDPFLANDLPIPVEALETLHFPTDLAQTDRAKRALAFEEMLSLQHKAFARRKDWDSKPTSFTFVPNTTQPHIDTAINALPFPLTGAQQQAIQHILHDLSLNKPMNRLLQGDVGAGKTVVSSLAAYAAYLHDQPSILLAPTEVLAEQHFETVHGFLEQHGVSTALVTGSTKTQDFHTYDVIVGTHALFHQTDHLPQPGLVIIDEQHKFGVDQRATLIQSGAYTPHVLSMTATPIPRSIALTIYGDQDLSLIDELPPGRKPVHTWLVPENKRLKSYAWIKNQIQNSEFETQNSPQALIVYPLIDESESETMADVQSATKNYEKLTKVFAGLNVALLHGRMSSEEKNTIIKQFREGTIDVLVATSVVEVGIDAPNATIITIENAERFGLATLHQLRGRVGRRGQQAYCFLFSPTDDPVTIQRLQAMETHHNGMTLSEIDMKLRGPGQVFGARQHGVGELRFASIQDLDLIQKAREAVRKGNI